MNKPISVFEIQGDAPQDFEDVLRMTMLSDSAWSRFVQAAEQEELVEAARILLRWRQDLAGQRKVMSARVQAGIITTRRHATWLAKAQVADQKMLRRQRDLPNPGAPRTGPQAEITAGLRKRLTGWHDVGSKLVLALIAFEAGDVTRADLSALLDDTTVDIGKPGRMSLRAAATYFRKRLDTDDGGAS